MWSNAYAQIQLTSADCQTSACREVGQSPSDTGSGIVWQLACTRCEQWSEISVGCYCIGHTAACEIDEDDETGAAHAKIATANSANSSHSAGDRMNIRSMVAASVNPESLNFQLGFFAVRTTNLKSKILQQRITRKRASAISLVFVPEVGR